MRNKNDRNTPKSKESRGRMVRKSYDTITQPKGKFKDLFRLMQEQKDESKSGSGQKDKSSK